MTVSAAEFFDGLAERQHEPRLEKANGSVRLDLTNGKQEHWVVAIKKGDLAVSRDRGDADCVFRMPKSVFERIINGEQNAMASFLRGESQVQGNAELLILFQRLFPGPSQSRATRRAGAGQRRAS